MTRATGAPGTAPRTKAPGGPLTRGLRDIGLIALAIGAASLPALVVDAASGPTPALPGLAALAGAGLGLGSAALILTPAGEARSGSEALIAIALGWLLAAGLAAVPFHLAALTDPAPSPTLAAFERPAVALFEAMSGITGTGLSVSEDPSALPPSLQLWRSSMQWAGGIGWMMLALVLLTPLPGPAERRRRLRRRRPGARPTAAISPSSEPSAPPTSWRSARATP